MKPLPETKWYCKQGQDFSVLLWRWKIGTDPPEYLDLTGRTYRGQVRKKFGLTTAQAGASPLFNFTCVLTAAPDGDNNTAVKISVADTVTAAIKDGVYYFDIWERTTGGVDTPIVSGIFTLQGRATV